jgi:replicative superfamily II helicase
MIVTTPEKWDVITRKSSDMSLSMLVKLIIIDEVHLLNDERGSVIEALVARTLRQVTLSLFFFSFFVLSFLLVCVKGATSLFSILHVIAPL